MTQPAPDPVVTVTPTPTFEELATAAEQAESADIAAQTALLDQTGKTAGVVGAAQAAHDKSVSDADAAHAQAVAQADAALVQATSDAKSQLSTAQAVADAAKIAFRKTFGALVQAARTLDAGVLDPVPADPSPPAPPAPTAG